MFEGVWEINLSDGYVRHDPMMDKKKRKQIAKDKRHLKFELKRLLEEDKNKISNSIQKQQKTTIAE